MKVALVHYWLVGMRGGEKVLETFCDIFPDADIFTLVADPDKLSPKLRRHRLTTSFLQKAGAGIIRRCCRSCPMRWNRWT
mgnify:CR=1 FL=1